MIGIAALKNKKLHFKVIEPSGGKYIMKLKNNILIFGLLVMLFCCISVASATDVDNMTVPDDTAIIELDDAVDSVEEVESDVISDDADDVSDNVVLRGTPSDLPQINGIPYRAYFNDDGTLDSAMQAYNLVFTGSFNDTGIEFDRLVINRQAYLDLTGATFNNVGLDILANNTILNGGTFNSDGTSGNEAVIYVDNVTNVEIRNAQMNLVAPNATDYIAIDVNNSENAKLYYNTITYTCNYTNPTNFNYVIRAKNSKNIEINYNTIDATLPLKEVNWNLSGSIDADYVAGVAIENCENAKFKYNTLDVTANNRSGGFPTLDAFIIALSPNAEIEHNTINEDDIVTKTNEYSYIYGIDVYSCNNTKINNNTVNMNGGQSGGHIKGGNGTGAAYCIQLSGNHSNVKVSNNKLTTKNQGPNLGIYSQNYNAHSYLKIYGNTINVSGKAGNDPWSLVSGIEVQDTQAEIYSNTINVNNTAGYHAGYYAFGISYAQWINKTHDYDISDNIVTVINGDYAVYLLNNTNVSGSVEDNTLKAITNSSTPNTGDNAVFAGSLVDVRGND